MQAQTVSDRWRISSWEREPVSKKVSKRDVDPLLHVKGARVQAAPHPARPSGSRDLALASGLGIRRDAALADRTPLAAV
jgi:hypothetical protein